jgi:hypothetical protein
MFQYPLEIANVLLILVGVVLFGSGPWIAWKTATGMAQTRKNDPQASLHWGNNLVNFLIAFLFFVAGILFVLNNLRGNPLS